MSDVLTKVDQIARMAGINGQRSGELMMYGFDLGKGRDQTVAVAHSGESDDGMNIVTFFSPCQRLAGGFLKGLSKARALQLLRLNTELPFGHFCIMTIGDEEMVCVRATQILETMEVQEFESLCVGVAQVADDWEMKLGRDEF